MDLYHVTPLERLADIQELGLRVDASKGKLRGIWLVHRDRLEWAWLHVSKHQETPASDMVAVAVDVTRETLTYRGQKVWISKYDIPPAQIGLPILHDEIIQAGD